MKVKYAISGGHERTVEIAEMILRDGGNAFDAAIAAHFAMYITEPCMASAGAGGFAMCKKQGENIKLLDFFVQTPLAKPQMNEIDFESICVDFGNETEEFHIGMASIATPGSIAGIFELYERYASMPLNAILDPVRDLAKSGVCLNTFQSIDMHLLEDVFKKDKTVETIFFNDGRLIDEGELLYMPHLIDFLDFISSEGRDGFYKGEISRIVDEDSKNKGGFIRRSDFENYQAIWRNPMYFNYGKNIVAVPNGPSLGGAIMALLFRQQLMNNHDWFKSIFNFKSKKFSIQSIEQDMAKYMPHCMFNLNSRHLATKGTSHFNILDQFGNAIALTCTIGEGAGYFVPGTDMQMNNMMGESFLLPEGFHNWTSDVRLNSMMTPTMVVDENHSLRLICGSGGAGRIPFMIGQMIDFTCLKNLSLEQAMNSPRIYVHEDKVHFEIAYEGSFDQNMESVEWKHKSLFFGGVHAIKISDSNIEALGDPRRYGAAIIN